MLSTVCDWVWTGLRDIKIFYRHIREVYSVFFSQIIKLVRVFLWVWILQSRWLWLTEIVLSVLLGLKAYHFD